MLSGSRSVCNSLSQISSGDQKLQGWPRRSFSPVSLLTWVWIWAEILSNFRQRAWGPFLNFSKQDGKGTGGQVLPCTVLLPIFYRGARGATLPAAALCVPDSHTLSSLQGLQQDVLKPTVVIGKHLKVSSFHFKDSY